MVTFYDFNGVSTSKMEAALEFEGLEKGKDYDIFDGTLVISAQGRKRIFTQVMTNPYNGRILDKMIIDVKMTGPLYFFDIIKDLLNSFESSAVFDETPVLGRILDHRLDLTDFSIESINSSDSAIFRVNFNTLIDTLNIARQRYIDVWNGKYGNNLRLLELTNSSAIIAQLLPNSYNNECHFVVDYYTLRQLAAAFDNVVAYAEIKVFNDWLKTLPLPELLIPNPEDSLPSYDEPVIWRD